eukprot:TRINITY_DN567_c0_g1_i1.p1 TRINITY_DN567_c0_g1~~TRINITY_DN567_c0_g1_i1.p1  ORF type:complete len:182 (+),score=44.12 TRINITY_DN567_c0_g1_i1:140-685(+)
MRKLKFHEQKLLKKVNFLEWKQERGGRELQVMRKYHITGRDDYKKYNNLCGSVTKIVNFLKKLDPNDSFKVEMTKQLVEKLHNMGVINDRNLESCERLSVSALCRRRLAVVLVKKHFAETMKEAVTFIEQGHIRVGTETITEPAYLVTRKMEDFVTWVDTSAIRRKVLAYNERLDDYDILQ